MVPIFYDNNTCPKQIQRNQNQNKVNEAKTVENIKYESILSQLLF